MKTENNNLRILSIGSGVIGTTYLWQFAMLGHDAAILVRDSRQAAALYGGFTMNCVDKRGNRRFETTRRFFPAIQTWETAADEYDIVLVSVQRQQADEVLQQVADTFPAAFIVVMQNHWDCRGEVTDILAGCRWIWAFPHMVGGTREAGRIDTILFGDGATRVGLENGQLSDSVRIFLRLLREADLKPKLTRRIEDWIATHYIQQSSGIAVFNKYGSPAAVAGDSARITEMVRIAREGLKVCAMRGMRPWSISPINMLYLPLPLLAWGFKKMLSDPDELAMITGHCQHGADEMAFGFHEVLQTGTAMGLTMDRWKEYLPYVERQEILHDVSLDR
ncbi:ketopantoate reductase family protein [Spirochaeta africana]|uniref:Ketopantoate reductase n=1 Tax=Spirochaeta africana (strain ATCC 700263 / DSM 8902 / Z-7692) TaxID=889378 RepID=H9UIV8_SPIAZ|nr:2-dehydropantoate 2-reductase N-terminal domain-containing protein [Spirochaeta africana]AFG37451.1 ketopantoate reductase [Spirochaeta africana DSM 8902]